MARHGIKAGKTHLETYAGQPAVDALTELIWNGLDAEATSVEVRIERGSLGDDAAEFVSRLWVTDTGHGIEPATAVERFTSLGDSWKAGMSGRTLNGERVLHGQHGRGRFYAYSLGHRVTWQSVWEGQDGTRSKTRISGSTTSIDEFDVSDPEVTTEAPGTAVEIRVEQGRSLNALLDEELSTRVLARLAPHLLGNPDIEVRVDGRLLDAERVVERQPDDVVLDEIDEDDLGSFGPPVLRIIEWRESVRAEMPTIVLCNEGGAALAEFDRRKPGKQPVRVTGYLLWAGFEKSAQDLLVAGMSHSSVLDAARERVASYVKERSEQLRGTIVEQLREEGSYPYPERPSEDDAVLRAEQQLYDVVLVAARSALGATQRERRMSARLMQIAVQERTGEIDDLIDEVLGLPPDVREVLRDLLKDTTLAQVVKAGGEVRERIELIVGLRRLLYSPDTAKQMREVDQLHPLVEGNEWLFGEEWRLARSETSLTNVLREVVADSVVLEDELAATGGQVLRTDGTGGRVDLLLQRLFRGPSGKPERLIVELKRPSLTLTPGHLEQVRSYARALERHQGVVNGHWTFWLVGTEFDADLQSDAEQMDRAWGHVDKRPNYDIFVARWSDLIESAERRFEFLRQQLDLEIGQEDAARRLRARHGDLIPEISEPGIDGE